MVKSFYSQRGPPGWPVGDNNDQSTNQLKAPTKGEARVDDSRWGPDGWGGGGGGGGGDSIGQEGMVWESAQTLLVG